MNYLVLDSMLDHIYIYTSGRDMTISIFTLYSRVCSTIFTAFTKILTFTPSVQICIQNASVSLREGVKTTYTFCLLKILVLLSKLIR